MKRQRFGKPKLHEAKNSDKKIRIDIFPEIQYSVRSGATSGTTPVLSARRGKSAMKIIVATCCFIVCLLSLPNASVVAQTPRPPKNPLETYDNPPSYIYRLETGPRMVSPFGPFTSYQANVDANGNNIIGDAANECSIATDATNPLRMAIGWRQFNNVASNFRQGGWGYTTDGGLTWRFPGVLENNVFRSDPGTGIG